MIKTEDVDPAHRRAVVSLLTDRRLVVDLAVVAKRTEHGRRIVFVRAKAGDLLHHVRALATSFEVNGMRRLAHPKTLALVSFWRLCNGGKAHPVIETAGWRMHIHPQATCFFHIHAVPNGRTAQAGSMPGPGAYYDVTVDPTRRGRLLVAKARL